MATVVLAALFALFGEPSGAATGYGDEIGRPSAVHLAWNAVGTTIGDMVRHDEVRQTP